MVAVALALVLGHLLILRGEMSENVGKPDTYGSGEWPVVFSVLVIAHACGRLARWGIPKTSRAPSSSSPATRRGS